jgi:hypothetical protein
MMEKFIVLFFLIMAAVFSSMSVKALNMSYEAGQNRGITDTAIEVGFPH